ncbi:MAG: hypothetical protein SGPRY_011306, partial [Prymnesium sp.]
LSCSLASVVQIRFRNGSDCYLDGLIVEAILVNLCAKDLAIVSTVCRALRAPAQQAAHRGLVKLVQSSQGMLLRHCERGSWVSQLREWETVRSSCVMWLQAEPPNMILVKQGEQRFVKRCADLSGNGNLASMYQRMPLYKPGSLNGHGTLDFDGASVLKTRPFAQPLEQPVTLMVVARARGDTTIIDSLGPKCVLLLSSRFELCHGYPSGWHPSPEICMTASGNDYSPKHSLRGRRACPGLLHPSPAFPPPGTLITRGTGDWHVYTAIFDTRRSEIFVDGCCEATGKNVGNNVLDGLSIGCDHNGIFFLNGSLAEIRLYHCHLPTAQRVQTEFVSRVHLGLHFEWAIEPFRSRVRRDRELESLVPGRIFEALFKTKRGALAALLRLVA